MRVPPLTTLIEKACYALPVGVVIIDRSGAVVWLNHAFEIISGHDIESLRGQHVDVLVPPEHREGHAEKVADYFKSPTARLMIAENRSIHLLHADGSVVPVEIYVSPFNGDHAAATVIEISGRMDRVVDALRLLSKELLDLHEEDR